MKKIIMIVIGVAVFSLPTISKAERDIDVVARHFPNGTASHLNATTPLDERGRGTLQKTILNGEYIAYDQRGIRTASCYVGGSSHLRQCRKKVEKGVVKIVYIDQFCCIVYDSNGDPMNSCDGFISTGPLPPPGDPGTPPGRP